MKDAPETQTFLYALRSPSAGSYRLRSTYPNPKILWDEEEGEQ